jgi:Phage integrase family
MSMRPQPWPEPSEEITAAVRAMYPGGKVPLPVAIREIPLHTKLHEDLDLWLAERPDWPGATTNPALFLNRRSTRLSARSTSAIIANIVRTAGLDEQTTAHILRHHPHTRAGKTVGGGVGQGQWGPSGRPLGGGARMARCLMLLCPRIPLCAGCVWCWWGRYEGHRAGRCPGWRRRGCPERGPRGAVCESRRPGPRHAGSSAG